MLMLLKIKSAASKAEGVLLGKWNLKGEKRGGGGGGFREPEQIGCFYTQECLFLAAGPGLLTRLGNKRQGEWQRISPARNRPTPSILGQLYWATLCYTGVHNGGNNLSTFRKQAPPSFCRDDCCYRERPGAHFTLGYAGTTHNSLYTYIFTYKKNIYNPVLNFNAHLWVAGTPLAVPRHNVAKVLFNCSGDSEYANNLLGVELHFLQL